jgi:(carboxyethyl)arginine beta-lactam-synthase
MDIPAITGFRVRAGGSDDPGPMPVLADRGPAVPVVAGAGPRLAGWVHTNGTTASGVCSAGGVTVLLAGELYHRDDLRAVAGPTAAATDAELLLHCWSRYGATGLRLLDGRFAAVIAEAGTVVVATDHAASVPVYVRTGPAGVEVATEAKALAGGPPGTGVLAGTDAIPGSAGIRRVRAGTAVRIASGAAEAMTTWRPPLHRVRLPEDEAVRRVAEVLDDAVRTRLDVPDVTVVLSGGIDSSSVAALATRAGAHVTTVSLGTDARDELAQAREVADHLGSTHREIRVGAEDLVRQLPFAVAAAEIVDADVVEYLLPLVVLYRDLPAFGRRVLTGYGADIPLGGMHRGATGLSALDALITMDMATFDGLNELSPVLGRVGGHWTTHPFWDRAVLDLLTSLEPGLKRRHGLDKWVLRTAMARLLPEETVTRPKLGIHEGSGTTSAWTAMLADAGVPEARVAAVKRAMTEAMYTHLVVRAESPDGFGFDAALDEALAASPVVTR